MEVTHCGTITIIEMKLASHVASESVEESLQNSALSAVEAFNSQAQKAFFPAVITAGIGA
jgi:hypothetical protein